jgi:hypothetical protein
MSNTPIPQHSGNDITHNYQGNINNLVNFNYAPIGQPVMQPNQLLTPIIRGLNSAERKSTPDTPTTVCSTADVVSRISKGEVNASLKSVCNYVDIHYDKAFTTIAPEDHRDITQMCQQPSHMTKDRKFKLHRDQYDVILLWVC